MTSVLWPLSRRYLMLLRNGLSRDRWHPVQTADLLMLNTCSHIQWMEHLSCQILQEDRWGEELLLQLWVLLTMSMNTWGIFQVINQVWYGVKNLSLQILKSKMWLRAITKNCDIQRRVYSIKYVLAELTLLDKIVCTQVFSWFNCIAPDISDNIVHRILILIPSYQISGNRDGKQSTGSDEITREVMHHVKAVLGSQGHRSRQTWH